MESMVEGMEHAFVPLLQLLRVVVEATAAFWIMIGVGWAVAAMVVAHIRNHPENFRRIRLRFSRYLSLALEFQLAADLLSTAIAPTFEELGRLGVIAVIRTGLNFFLSKEMKEEQLEIAEQKTRVEAKPTDVYRTISPPAIRA
jgi:uncharacterized membrane protein